MFYRNHERILLYACLAVVAAACYDFFIQYAAVPSCMRYVPPASTAYIVTSSLRGLWTGARPHVERFFEDQPGASGKAKSTAATDFARGVRRALDDKKIKLRAPDDLPDLGIDPEGNAAVVIVGGWSNPTPLIALPTIDQAKFKQTLAQATGKPVEPQQGRDAGPRLYKSGDAYFGFGADGAAVVSVDDELVASVLDNQDRNLAYFRSSDRLLRDFRELVSALHRRSDAWVRGALIVADDSNGPLRDLQLVLTFVLTMDERAAVLNARTTLPDGGSSLSERLSALPADSLPLTGAILTGGNGTAVLVDPSLPYYLRYLDLLTEQTAPIDQRFPGLLPELRTLRTFDRASVAVTEESQRVPGLVVGLRMASDEADDLVFHVQRAVRLKRDRDILRAAAARYRADSNADFNIESLRASGLLSDERHPLWRRYALNGGEVVADPELDREDFSDEAYRQERTPFVFRYLFPPVTGDDLAYRLDPKRVDEQELKADKYRPCSSYVAGTLWLASDAGILGRWLTRLQESSNDSDLVDAAKFSARSSPAKLGIFMRPRDLFESAQLYPDAGVNDFARSFLSDVSHYRVVLLSQTASAAEREIDVAATFLLF